MSFAQGPPTQPLSLLASNVFVTGNSTAGNAFTVQQLGAGNVASFLTSTGVPSLFINTSGNVGLGTTNPDQTLTVGSAGSSAVARIANTMIIGTTTAMWIQNSSQGSSGGSSFCLYQGTNGDTVLNAASGQTIQYKINNVEYMRIISTGNVGVGLTNPQSQFDSLLTLSVSATSSPSTGFLRLVSTGSANFIQSGLAASSGSAAPLIFTTMFAGTEWARFNSSGQLGIGTNSPGALLDVQGGNIRVHTPATSLGTIEFKRSSDGWNPATIQQQYNTGSYGGDLAFQLHPADNTLATAPATVMYLKAGGNIGIGTASPQNTLHVQGGTLVTNPTVYNIGAAAWYQIGYWDCTNAQNAGAHLKVRFMGCNGYSGGNITGLNSGGEITLYATNLNNFNTGVVNVDAVWKHEGGTPPFSNIFAIQNGSSRYQYYFVAWVQSYTQYSVTAETTQGTIFTSLFNSTTAPTSTSSSTQQQIQFLSASVGANVGIGTTAPYTITHIYNANAGSPLTTGTNTDPSTILRVHCVSCGLDFGYLGGGGAWIQNRQVTSSFGTTFPINLNPNGGGVTVGTALSSVSYTLQVSGSVGGSTSFTRTAASTSTAFAAPGTGLASTDYNYILSGANDTANRLVVFVNGSARTADGGVSNVTIRNDAGSLILGSASYPQIIYGSTVGINTTSPGSTLDVNGSMNAQNFGQPTFTNQQYTTITTATSMAGTVLGGAGGITITKTASGTNTWDACAYSNQSYKYGAYCSARASQTNQYVMFGLSTNQTASLAGTAYASISYAWYFVADTTLHIYENGSDIGAYGTYYVTTTCSITYDGFNITYWKDGVAVRVVARAVGAPLYFMCTPWATGGSSINNVIFGEKGNTTNPGQVITASTGMFSNTVYACKTGASASGAETPGLHAVMAVAPDGATVNASIWMGFDPTNDCGYINSARSGQIRPVCLQTRGGNVGIGTTGPACLLHVGSGTDAYGQTMGFLCTNPGNNWINGCFGQTGLPKVVIGNLSSAAVLGAHNATLGAWANLALCPAGNVGIGTYTPSRRLHVYDSSTSGAGPFVVDQFATSGFTDCVTLFRGGQAASSSWSACFMQSSSGGNNLFYVRGDGYVWAANDITAFSDGRVKTNLQIIDNALDRVGKLNGYTYTRSDFEDESDRQRRHAGLIAQEVQKVLPEVVHEDDKGMLSVTYGNMVALLIEAVKEERAERLKVEERLERIEKLLLKE